MVQAQIDNPVLAIVQSKEQGILVNLSPSFTPSHLLGMTVRPDNPLKFDFFINKGDQILKGNQKKDEYKKLVKYFLASLAIPDEDQWVNLSPYEKDRIIKDNFGKTEMGRDLLVQDYLLKQITSSLIYPENGLGKEFWKKIYERAWSEYHTTNIPVNTFNKVWIVPDEALVCEKGNTAYIIKSHLKVMLEEDYLSLQKHTKQNLSFSNVPSLDRISSQLIRQIILPALEREVNEGKNFANLRQMYSGMVLATWYKKELKESLLGKIYADKGRIKGVDQDPQSNQLIYQNYLKAFKKGVFNYIKEDVNQYTHERFPRKYFSGGFTRDRAMKANDGQTHLIPDVAVILSNRLKPEQIRLVLKAMESVGDIVSVNLNPMNVTDSKPKITVKDHAMIVIKPEDAHLDRTVFLDGLINQDGLPAQKIIEFKRSQWLATMKSLIVSASDSPIVPGYAYIRFEAGIFYQQHLFRRKSDGTKWLHLHYIGRDGRDLGLMYRLVFSGDKIVGLENPMVEDLRANPELISIREIDVQGGAEQWFTEQAELILTEEVKSILESFIARGNFGENHELYFSTYPSVLAGKAATTQIMSDTFNTRFISVDKRKLMVSLDTGIVYDLSADEAMAMPEDALKGGIDFNASNLNLQIKHDASGMILPWSKQDMAQLNRIQGFEPEIIEIKQAVNIPMFNELREKQQLY